jgi:hypothetical protein
MRTYQFSLLDKRLAVLKTVSAVLARYHSEPGGMDDRNDQLFHCLLDGRTLFGVELAQRLHRAWLDQVAYHDARQSFLKLAGPPKKEDREEARTVAEALRQRLFETVKGLHRDMIAATRVEVWRLMGSYSGGCASYMLGSSPPQNAAWHWSPARRQYAR